MAVLVTGGHGFVGMHIVNELIAQGNNVVVMDLQQTPPGILQPVADKYTCVQGDITELDDVLRIVDDQRIEGIIHLAAIKFEKQCRSNPIRAYKTNLGATLNMYEAARLRGLRRVVTLSSAVVFSQWADPRVPVRESDPPSPVGLYSTLKRADEELGRVYRQIYNTPVVTIRISRVYGPGVMAPMIPKESNPIPQLMWDVLKHGRIHQETGADFAADFSYVKDVARGIVLSYTNEALPSHIINIGAGKLVQVMEVVEAIKRLYPEIPVYVGPTGEPYASQAPVRGALDISLAKAELEYEPQYSLQQGLIEYMEWLKEAARKTN